MIRKTALAIALLILVSPAAAQIGRRFPSEKKVVKDPVTGTMLTFLTSTPNGDSKIYQTHNQWTSDGKWLIFRSNRVPGEAIAVNEEAGEIIKLVMRHWNWVASELHRTLTEEHVYLPVLLEDDQGVAHGNDWARGFMRGVQARPGSWDGLLTDDSEVGSLLPM